MTTPSYSQQPVECRPLAASGVPEAPRPLTEGGLRSLVAFTRLVGYIRHFHPSDQAAAADWDRLAVEGMRRVEACEGPERLAAALEAFFRPIAPTVQVFPSGSKREPPVLAPSKASDLRIVSWRHRGAGQVALKHGQFPSLYTSERVFAAASSHSVSGDAGGLYSPDLGAGLTARVPLKLHADAAGTLPHVPALAPGEKSELSANDRATRLAAVALAWNVFQHFYPYFDVVGTDLPLALRTALSAAATDAGERAFLDTLRRLVAALHDGHGGVAHPALLDRRHSLPLSWALIEDKLVITSVLAEATAAGLAPGDVVLAIDGQPGAAVFSSARGLISSATAQWMRYRFASSIRLGPPDSTVRIELQAQNGARREVELRRSVAAEAISEPRPPAIAELEPGIHYFDIDRAKEADWSAALPKLAQAKAVIFDLRGYPRMHEYLFHLSAEPLQSAIWQVPIVALPDRLGSPGYDTSGRWKLPPRSPRLLGRIIFLIDGRAISYAESVMGIVEAYKLADIVGEATAGTNGNVNSFAVPGGFTLHWTGMRVLKHDGSSHHGVGILPTHPVARTVKGVAEGRDEILEKGLELARQSRTPAPDQPRR